MSAAASSMRVSPEKDRRKLASLLRKRHLKGILSNRERTTADAQVNTVVGANRSPKPTSLHRSLTAAFAI